MEKFCRAATLWICAASLLFLCADSAGAAGDESDTQRQVRQLQQQNDLLQQQMRRQQELIEELSRKVSKLQSAEDHRKTEQDSEGTRPKDAESSQRSASGFSLGKVHLSGEGAIGLFHSQPQGQFPNGEFRVDEAKVFIEAPIWDDVYFFSEINLFTREEGGPNLWAGELYLD